MDSTRAVLVRPDGERVEGIVHLQAYRGSFAGTFKANDESSTFVLRGDELAIEREGQPRVLISAVMTGQDGTLFFLPRSPAPDGEDR